MTRRILALACVFSLWSAVAGAQQPPGTGAVAAELTGGHAGFVDDATIHHGVIGGALRWYVSPRISVGPELAYMRGPDDDRDLMLTGNVTFDLRAPAPGRVVTPFLVAGAGLFRHSDRIGPVPFSSSEGAFTAGGGVRARVSDRWFVGGEARFGWELHTRLSLLIGFKGS